MKSNKFVCAVCDLQCQLCWKCVILLQVADTFSTIHSFEKKNNIDIENLIKNGAGGEGNLFCKVERRDNNFSMTVAYLAT